MDSILFLFYPITLGGRRGTTDEFANDISYESTEPILMIFHIKH